MSEQSSSLTRLGLRQGTVEEMGTLDLVAGQSIEIMVEYTNTKAPEGPEADRSQPALMRGVVGVT